MTQILDPDDFVIRRPPHLSLEDFVPFAQVGNAEIDRLGVAKTRVIPKRERAQLVLAEAWLGHLDELYISAHCLPFRGDASVYVERLVVDAARHIHDFLAARVPIWVPKMQHPRFAGRLHRAVSYLVNRRIQARGGGCEICRVDVPLDVHHLNYRSFGYETPSDIMELCRDCHRKRHRQCGWPKDASWQDSLQWPQETE
jgi:hypothetical protein